MRWERALAVSAALLVALPAMGYHGVPVPGTPATSASLGQWTNVSGARAPPAAAGNMLAYDSNTNQFLYFGGWNGSVPSNETWAFDPVANQWTELSPARAPSPRADGALTYDPVDRLFYLFGGWGQTSGGTTYRLNGTWTFSLTRDTWSRIPTPIAPSPRSDAAVSFDAVADTLVLFGGFNGTSYLGDTWTFAPGIATWSRSALVGPSPSSRADGRMSYDPVQSESILFGGNNNSGPGSTAHHFNDTWAFRLPRGTWTRLVTPQAPGARDYAVQAFDSADGWTLLFGGYGNQTILNDLWALDAGNATWFPLHPGGAPPPRFAGVGGYDSRNQTLMVFAGLGGAPALPAAHLLNDTWVLGAGGPGSPSPSVPWWVILGVAIGAGVAVVVVGLILRGGRRPSP